jgi:outer membrane receptor protein involved in Fe transport
MPPAAQADEEAHELPPVIVSAGRPVAASSEKLIPDEDFELRPQGRPADILRLAPGLIIGQHAGGGKADQTFLRGFDNDHGTDLALSIDGVPINVRSHAHGQGYADLHGLIPETIRRIDVHKGPFRVEDGDFAASGAVDFVPKDSVPESFIQSGAGPFDTQRHVAVVSPPAGEGIRALSAYEVYHTDGPFLNDEKYDRFNTYQRLSVHPSDELDAALSLSYMTGAWHGSGQIPLREVSAGRLDRFDAVDPSEGGDSQRLILAGDIGWRPSEEQRWRVKAYAQRYALDLFSNFTFFKDDPVNGDGIEQVDERWIYGADASVSRDFQPGGRGAVGTLGVQTRWDRGRVILAKQRARARLSDTQDVDLSEVSYGPYAKLDLQLLDWLRFIGGGRLDVFHYDVNDRLGAALDGSETDWIPSIKGNLVVGPWRGTQLFLNAATGFHSNDARDAIANPDAETLPQASGYEAGMRAAPLPGMELSASLWLLNLESELVFVGDAGETEARGRTRRYGTELGARYFLTDWLSVAGDVTVSKAYFTATGEAVPRAPKFTARAEASVRLPQGVESTLELRHLGTRWLTENRSWEAQGFTLCDWTTRYRMRRSRFDRVELFLSVENLLDADYREAQFLTETQLAGEAGPVEDLHFAAGNPRTFLAGVTVYF